MTWLTYALDLARHFTCGATTGHDYRAWDACPSLAMCARCRKPYTAVRGDTGMP